jgi:hypothetical protein
LLLTGVLVAGVRVARENRGGSGHSGHGRMLCNGGMLEGLPFVMHNVRLEVAVAVASRFDESDSQLATVNTLLQ